MSTPEAADELAFDVTEANFTEAVVEASREVLVLVDFWANWCEPCHKLGAVLETLLAEACGGFKLARVDTDKEQRLAAMFRVQSLPLVVAFKDGRPADVLSGAVPIEEVRRFLEQQGVKFSGAEEAEIQEVTPLMQVTEALAKGGRLDFKELADKLMAIEDDLEDYADAQRILDARSWFSASYPDEAEAAKLASVAHELWTAGEVRKAMEKLLESVALDPSWQEELGRKAIVALMQLLPQDKDFVDTMRRRLAVMLY